MQCLNPLCLNRKVSRGLEQTRDGNGRCLTAFQLSEWNFTQHPRHTRSDSAFKNGSKTSRNRCAAAYRHVYGSAAARRQQFRRSWRCEQWLRTECSKGRSRRDTKCRRVLATNRRRTQQSRGWKCRRTGRWLPGVDQAGVCVLSHVAPVKPRSALMQILIRQNKNKNAFTSSEEAFQMDIRVQNIVRHLVSSSEQVLFAVPNLHCRFGKRKI